MFAALLLLSTSFTALGVIAQLIIGKAPAANAVAGRVAHLLRDLP